MILNRELGFSTGPAWTQAEIEAAKSFYGLDKPIWEQYLISLTNIFRGNLGRSFYSSRYVVDIIMDRLPATIQLQLVSTILSLAIAIPAGVYAATHQYKKRDFAIVSFTLFGISFPYFWFALLMIILFAGILGWFPAVGYVSVGEYLYGSRILDNIWHMVLPVGVMTFVSLAVTLRVMRQGMLEVIKEDYVIAARSLGLKERTVIWKHALRNAITPIITSFGWLLASLVGGSAVTETIFGWPGMGRLFVSSLSSMDFPVVTGIVTITAILILGGNLLADILYSVVDPRIALE
jgi:peptide/nickel transport system permease protein